MVNPTHRLWTLWQRICSTAGFSRQAEFLHERKRVGFLKQDGALSTPTACANLLEVPAGPRPAPADSAAVLPCSPRSFADPRGFPGGPERSLFGWLRYEYPGASRFDLFLALLHFSAIAPDPAK